MPTKSQILAQEISTGTLSFTELDSCDAKLSPNLNPLTVIFNQIFLFPKNATSNSPYLSYSPFSKLDKLTDKDRTALANALSLRILNNGPIKKRITNEIIPNPKEDSRLLEKKNILIKNNLLISSQNLTEKQIHSEYKKFIDNKISAELKLYYQFYSSSVGITMEDFLVPEKLSAAIMSNLLDPIYAPKKASYILAFFGTYEQEWQHVGYTRGDLIKSLSLAPGETVDLEFHNWDKSIIKNEQELFSELESKFSSTLTQRESKEVLNELTTNNQAKLTSGAKVDIPIPDTPIVVGSQNEAQLSGQIQTQLKNTLSNALESVVNAANNFKQSRKVRIEETRDTGREEKQTRVVANTNRCRTLEFRYFEILSNYVLTNRFLDVQPCLLLPYEVYCDSKILTSKSFNAKFILCNEAVLKNVLLNRKFLEGFEAAKKIESYLRLKKLYADNVSVPTSVLNVGISPSNTVGGDQNDIESEYGRLREAIVKAFDKINDSLDDFAEKVKDLPNNAVEAAQSILEAGVELVDDLFDNRGGNDNQRPSIRIVDVLEDISTDLRRTVTYAALRLNTSAKNALDALQGSVESGIPARQAMRIFFGGVTENDFQFINPVQGDLSEAIRSLGVSDEIADIVSYLAYYQLPYAIVGGIGDTVKDDAGLHNAVQAAQSLFNTVDATPTGQLTSTPPTGTISPSFPPTIADFISLTDVASAYVELNRLVCHIQCNFEFYKQALWLSKGAGYRLEFLTRSKVRHLVKNEVIGFCEKCVAFPLLEEVVIFKKRIDIDKLKELIKDKIPVPVSDLITIPTSSTAMDGKLGDCNLCEEYIENSRLADVRQQNAKADIDVAEAAYRQAKAKISEQEAARIQARISANPPDLSDPIEHTNGKIDISVTTQEDNI